MKFDVRIPELKLEQYLLGELPEDEMKELRQREEADEIFAARVKSMREQNAKILQENPFEKLADKMAASDVDGSAGRNIVSLMPLLTKVAAVVVVALGIMSAVFMMNRDQATLMNTGKEGAVMDVAMADISSDTRIKGMNARMEIWKKSESGIVQLGDKDVASEGDELQLRYAVPEKCYGMLLSMDGNGVLTVHMGNENKAIALEPGKMTSLPFAYKLDNAPHFEKFFLLTSSNEFAVDGKDIDKSLKQAGLNVVSMTLRKNGGK